jgi:hypothetical protein
MNRCYCGTSLHVEIKYKRRRSTTPNTRKKQSRKEDGHSELVVYARFEPMNDGTNMLKMGDTIPHSILLEDSRGKEDTPENALSPSSTDASDYEKPWIQTEIETTKQQQQQQQQKEKEKDMTLVFVMNNCRFPKWYYAYESGSTKTQREMKHQIKVINPPIDCCKL